MNYSDISNFVCQNPWFTIFSFIVTLLSLILTVVFYIKSKKIKLPLYRTRNINLVNDGINKIKLVDILHDGAKIDNLSVSRIVIWNAGKDAIRSDDIVDLDKLRIEIDEKYEILEYEILYQEKPANNFKLTPKDRSILEIDFNYFDHEEGVIVQICHTATTDDSLKVKGAFIGAKNIIKDDSGKKAFTKFSKILNFPLFDSFLDYILSKKISALFLFLAPILLAILMYTQYARGMIIGFTILIYAVIFISYWFAAYMVLKINNLPKCFKLFESEFFSSTDSNESCAYKN
jgi:hypothetical protein